MEGYDDAHSTMGDYTGRGESVLQDELNAIVETQEQERNRIATDLHDGLGQTLTAINMYFGSLEEIFVELVHKT